MLQIDPYVEFRDRTNGLTTPAGSGLIDPLTYSRYCAVITTYSVLIDRIAGVFVLAVIVIACLPVTFNSHSRSDRARSCW